MWNKSWRVFDCSGILRYTSHRCSLSSLLCKFLPYSNLSIFLLLPRFIKDLNLFRMWLGTECCWLAFQGKSLSVERFPGKQRLRSWTEDRSEKSEKASLVAVSEFFHSRGLAPLDETHTASSGTSATVSFICCVCDRMKRTEESIHYWPVRNQFWCWLR